MKITQIEVQEDIKIENKHRKECKIHMERGGKVWKIPREEKEWKKLFE